MVKAVSFASYKAGDISDRTRAEVTDLLLESGEWTALRTRPYNKVPALGTTPSDIFVTAIDTRPLAADPGLYIAEQKEAFTNGLSVLAKLTDGAVFVCKAAETDFSSSVPQVKVETFSGPHPAGLVGTHIHFLSPVSAEKTVWHLVIRTSLPSAIYLRAVRFMLNAWLRWRVRVLNLRD